MCIRDKNWDLVDWTLVDCTIAAINGPNSTVISGAEDTVQAVVTQLENHGFKTKQLQVSHAFHSPLMQPMVTRFKQVAEQIEYSSPQLKLISNVTGQVIGEEIATPSYWSRHLLAPVNFMVGMQTLNQQGCDVFLECGPKPILLGMGWQCLSASRSAQGSKATQGVGADQNAWLPSLRPGQSDRQQLLTSLAELYVKGVTRCV